MDYFSMLSRAKEALPNELSSESRFVIPRVDILYEGKRTIWRNFAEIQQIIHRDASHFLPYILREIGTAGEQSGTRVIFQGIISKEQLQDRLNRYIDIYVICSVCKRPDTRLERRGRIIMLKCDACGAICPITRRKRR
ncbi:MAG TPA: translation initiation factor IF-2 subunit beta [Thermoplasmata archaeon]|nr:translation initiation factor IF-2 subunit beta [Thermoplasmata archaeon]HIH98016.1 translation initiation factor IF-2 subunit beta [Thermoplasmata archaeon]